VRAGVLERGGPRPRGCLALERGGPYSRGGVEPSSERTPPEGALGLERGGPHSRGVPLCRPGEPRGPLGAWPCLVCVLGA
jgi:hypothetical protein